MAPVLKITVLLFLPLWGYAVDFDDIKKRPVQQYELTDIITKLYQKNELSLLDRWKDLVPASFKQVDFVKAYILAGDRAVQRKQFDEAVVYYIRAYQHIGRHPQKIYAAYQAAFYLYARQKRAEALFYINRAVEELIYLKNKSILKDDIFTLKRRIVWRYFSRMDALPDNAVSAIAFDGDDVWIGLWSGGVVRFTRSSSELEIFSPRNSALPSFYIRDILVQKDKVWAATQSGLAYYDKKSSQWIKVPQFADTRFKRFIFENGSFYAATLYRGVFRSSDGIAWTNIIPSKSISDLLKIDDKLFVASPDQGVFVYQNNKLTPFLSNVTAHTFLHSGSNNEFWIGTYGQGLLRLDKDSGKIIRQYGHKELNSDYIESLAFVDGNLWIGTLGAGVTVFDGKSWQRLSLKDGMPDLDVTTITRERSHLWFGTLAGGIGIYLFQEEAPIQGAFYD